MSDICNNELALDMAYYSCDLIKGHKELHLCIIDYDLLTILQWGYLKLVEVVE